MSQNLFKIYDGRTGFWQWDTGQKLIVLDNNIDQVHFSTKDMMHALVSEVYTDGDGLKVCCVPDIILTLPKNLIAYAYILDEKMTRTVRSVKFPITPRPIPSNYISNQNDKIENIINKIEQLEDKFHTVEFKKFDSMEEAELWVKENDNAGILISVNIDGNWVAHIVEDDGNIAPVFDEGNYLTSDDGNELDNRIKVLEDNKVDWNQNDPTAKDYIKNRPFYNSVEEEPITVTYDGVNPIVDAELCAKIWANKRSAKYTVNGVEATYDGLSGTITDIYWMYTLRAGGTKYYIAARKWSKDSTEIDELLFMQASNANHVPGTVSFTSEHEVVHQLNEKYIPDSIARKTDIPEQVNADWDQDDPTAKDYIKNRPFYVGQGYRVVYPEMEINVSYDANVKFWSGKIIVDENDNFLSENSSHGSYVGKVYKIVIRGNEHIRTLEKATDGIPGYCIGSDIYSDHFTMFSTTPGVIEFRTTSGPSLCKIAVYELVDNVTYQLDEKFIPDTIARVDDINEAISTDNEIIDMLIEEDMLFAITDSDGSILVDENNNILTW